MSTHFIEMLEGERAGRGRFWKDRGYGYTDDILEAGLYPKDIAEAWVASASPPKYRAVEAAALLRQERHDAARRFDALDKKLMESRFGLFFSDLPRSTTLTRTCPDCGRGCGRGRGRYGLAYHNCR